MTDIPIHSKIKPNMHPDIIRGESQGAKSARVALTTLYIAEGKIRDLHSIVKDKALLHQKQAIASMPKPPDGKHKIAPALIYDQHAADMVITNGTPLAQKALQAADKAISSLGETVTRLDTTINQKVTAAKNPTRGPELRAWAARQESPLQKLGGLFQKATENATLVAEVLGAEHYLSGISAENQAHLRTLAANVLAPDEVEARSGTSKALDQLTAASKAFTGSMAEIFNGLTSADAAAISSIVKGDEQ